LQPPVARSPEPDKLQVYHAAVFEDFLEAGDQSMEVHFPPELEAKLAHSAAKQGRNPDELVRDVVTRYFEEEARFVEAVTRGEEALKCGEYFTHEQVGQRLGRFL
jgi:predicted transcriptional regulator